MALPISSSAVLVVSAILVGLALLYRAALPKPIPGIPYHYASARRVFGDIPSMMKWKKETNETFSWMTAQCKELNSPIVQIFVKPFSKPLVIVTDARECQDVLVRRGKEFDRSQFTIDVVQPIVREHFFAFPSGPKHRAHRLLLSDTMSPHFLNEIAAPQLYNATLELLHLWRIKATLARGHPFTAAEDIANAALDSIWAAAIGSEPRTTRSQIDLLDTVSIADFKLPASQETPVLFPHAPIPSDIISIRTVVKTVEVGLASPLPSVSYWFYKKIPRVKRAFYEKDMVLTNALNDSRKRLENTENNNVVTSAMDHILRKEILLAKKENRALRLNSTVLKDELFGFLLAGHETSSTTIAWGLKLLTDHQDTQQKLRGALRSAMPEVVGRQPAYSEIIAAKMPYLEAVIEEMLRCGGPAAAHARETLVETNLLGVRLPKGTNVLFMTNGPSFITPAMHVDENLRSQTCREAKDKIPEWDPTDLCEFKPERWLKTDSHGQVEMDYSAGHNPQFGGGSRGCFGKKLAYLEIRIFMCIIFWNFKLLPVPAELASYGAVDIVAHQPRQCFIRLAEAEGK